MECDNHDVEDMLKFTDSKMLRGERIIKTAEKSMDAV